MRLCTAICAALLGATAASAFAAIDSTAATDILQKNNCLACHAVDAPLVGPSYRAVAKKYAGDSTATDKLFHKVRDGGTGVWGQVGMPPNAQISDADLQSVIAWILAGPPEH
ncbi:cytochrome c [Paraburkholderia sp. BL8N3]|jgi:cytochrome c|nr:c-type cytochrome [Paraburkholderia sp. BL8N3]TCK39569.1 cytochrome c [Paraburkholderia sp. BL8N3]